LIGAPRRTTDLFHFDMEFLGQGANRVVNECAASIACPQERLADSEGGAMSPAAETLRRWP
jgi:hypothetical protein